MTGCPSCSGPMLVIGTLGKKTWLRCQDCHQEAHMNLFPVHDFFEDNVIEAVTAEFYERSNA